MCSEMLPRETGDKVKILPTLWLTGICDMFWDQPGFCDNPSKTCSVSLYCQGFYTLFKIPK